MQLTKVNFFGRVWCSTWQWSNPPGAKQFMMTKKSKKSLHTFEDVARGVQVVDIEQVDVSKKIKYNYISFNWWFLQTFVMMPSSR